VPASAAGRHVRPAAVILPLALLPGPAAATEALSLCRFGTECVEAEPCADTAYTLRVVPGDGDMTATLEDQSGSVPASLGVTPDGATWALARGGGVLRLLSVAPDGAARYTLHFTAAPMVLSYLGRCEDE